MNREQKIAWALVVSMSLAIILCMAAAVIHLFGGSLTKAFLIAAVVVQAAGGLACFRIKPDKGPVVSDERDKLIEKNADLVSLGAVYFLVIVASFAPIAIFGEKGMLPVTWCPALLVGAAFCQVYARSLTIVIQYGWRSKGEVL